MTRTGRGIADRPAREVIQPAQPSPKRTALAVLAGVILGAVAFHVIARIWL